MRNAALVSAATITPAVANGDFAIANMGRRRGADLVSGWGTRVRVRGISVAQQINASRL